MKHFPALMCSFSSQAFNCRIPKHFLYCARALREVRGGGNTVFLLPGRTLARANEHASSANLPGTTHLSQWHAAMRERYLLWTTTEVPPAAIKPAYSLLMMHLTEQLGLTNSQDLTERHTQDSPAQVGATGNKNS